MIDVLSVSNMRLSDEYTCKNIISSKELMFKAGKAIFDSYKFNGRVGIVCGSGNNAGDGYVLALLLKDNNIDVTLLLTKNKFSEDSLYYFNKCKEKSIKYILIDDNTSFDYDILVDCIFGTGFKGEVNEPYKSIILKYNDTKAFKISVDINSGLNGDTGLGDYIIKSDITFAIGSYKSGHLLNKAKDYINKLEVLDIGIKPIEKPYKLVEIKDFNKLINDRPNYSNKGDYGYVLLIGGSINYSGAIRLADMGMISLRMGSGVSTIAVPKSISQYIIPNILESTIYPLSDDNGYIKFNKEEIDPLLKRYKVISIGMGIGNNEETYKLLEYILLNYDKKLIIDADGLNALSKNVDLLYKTKAKIILTPHIKEFSRLINKDINDILDNQIIYAKEFAKKYNIILLLKGPATIITDGDEIYLVNRGTSGMATAGSGDVLSGILTGLLGYNDDILLAVSMGAYINGLAGEMAAIDNSNITMVSSDTINNIKNAYEYIIKKSSK